MRLEDAHDLLAAVAALAKLRYPIETPDRLVEQLPAGSISARVNGARIDLKSVARSLPASYFPITGLENLAAKAAQFLRENEHLVGMPRGVGMTIKRVADAAHFPIRDVANLRRAAEAAGVTEVTAGGRAYSIRSLLEQVRQDAFPIRDAQTLYRFGRRLRRR
jgi:hypothetical protein